MNHFYEKGTKRGRKGKRPFSDVETLIDTIIPLFVRKDETFFNEVTLYIYKKNNIYIRLLR